MKQVPFIIALLAVFTLDLEAKDAAAAKPAEGAVASVLELAIERGVPMFNAGDVAGCAAVYELALVSVVRLQPEGFDASRLVRGLEEGRAASGDEARAWAYRRAMDDTLDALDDDDFKPIIEAELPVGFPGPGPVGEVVVKEYPVYRGARTDGGRAFWSLFNHIQRNDIAMTAPVTMSMDVGIDDAGEPDRVAMTDMAFLYQDPAMGATGADPDDTKVEVTDWPAQTVLSIGMRGGRTAASIREAITRLDAGLAERSEALRIPESGKSYRLLGYNSPMVPADRRFYEVQLVVERVE